MEDVRQQMNERVKERVSEWADTAAKNAGWLIALGVIIVVAGFAAIANPWAGGRAVVTLIGIALVIAGGARVFGTFQAGSFGQGVLALIGGILTVLAGLVTISMPDIGLATLTLLIAGYLLADGIAGGVLAFRVRPKDGWAWMFLQRGDERAARDPAIQRMAALRHMGRRHPGRDQPAVFRRVDDLHRFCGAPSPQEVGVGTECT